MRFGPSRCENGHRRCFGPPNLEFLNTSRFHVGTLQEFKLNLQLQLRFEKPESCFQEKMPQLHVADFLLELHQRSDFFKTIPYTWICLVGDILLSTMVCHHHFSPQFGRIPGIKQASKSKNMGVSPHPPLEHPSLRSLGNFQLPSIKHWVVVSQIFYFQPEPWGNDPIWRAYFSNGLKPPTRTSLMRCCHALPCRMDMNLPTSPEELLGVGMNFAAVVSGIFGALTFLKHVRDEDVFFGVDGCFQK